MGQGGKIKNANGESYYSKNKKKSKKSKKNEEEKKVHKTSNLKWFFFALIVGFLAVAGALFYIQGGVSLHKDYYELAKRSMGLHSDKKILNEATEKFSEEDPVEELRLKKVQIDDIDISQEAEIKYENIDSTEYTFQNENKDIPETEKNTKEPDNITTADSWTRDYGDPKDSYDESEETTEKIEMTDKINNQPKLEKIDEETNFDSSQRETGDELAESIKESEESSGIQPPENKIPNVVNVEGEGKMEKEQNIPPTNENEKQFKNDYEDKILFSDMKEEKLQAMLSEDAQLVDSLSNLGIDPTNIFLVDGVADDGSQNNKNINKENLNKESDDIDLHDDNLNMDDNVDEIGTIKEVFEQPKKDNNEPEFTNENEEKLTPKLDEDPLILDALRDLEIDATKISFVNGVSEGKIDNEIINDEQVRDDQNVFIEPLEEELIKDGEQKINVIKNENEDLEMVSNVEDYTESTEKAFQFLSPSLEVEEKNKEREDVEIKELNEFNVLHTETNFVNEIEKDNIEREIEELETMSDIEDYHIADDTERSQFFSSDREIEIDEKEISNLEYEFDKQSADAENADKLDQEVNEHYEKTSFGDQGELIAEDAKEVHESEESAKNEVYIEEKSLESHQELIKEKFSVVHDENDQDQFSHENLIYENNDVSDECPRKKNSNSQKTESKQEESDDNPGLSKDEVLPESLDEYKDSKECAKRKVNNDQETDTNSQLNSDEELAGNMLPEANDVPPSWEDIANGHFD